MRNYIELQPHMTTRQLKITPAGRVLCAYLIN